MYMDICINPISNPITLMYIYIFQTEISSLMIVSHVSVSQHISFNIFYICVIVTTTNMLSEIYTTPWAVSVDVGPCIHTLKC